MIGELCAVSTEHTMGGGLRGVAMLILLAWLSVLLCHQPGLSVGSPGPSSDAVFYHYTDLNGRNGIRDSHYLRPTNAVFGEGMGFQCNYSSNGP
jgi:hypothetical protein